MRRYIQAFFQALAMTIRGETVKPPIHKQHPQWAAWLRQVQVKLSAVDRAIQKSRIDTASITIKVDGRVTSMTTIVQAVHFHTESEYPHLLMDGIANGETAIYAMNINDQYAVQRLIELGDMPNEVVDALGELRQALDSVPSNRDKGT